MNLPEDLMTIKKIKDNSKFNTLPEKKKIQN